MGIWIKYAVACEIIICTIISTVIKYTTGWGNLKPQFYGKMGIILCKPTHDLKGNINPFLNSLFH